MSETMVLFQKFKAKKYRIGNFLSKGNRYTELNLVSIR